ncbi:MarR family transcriptional regulator [Cutibacterium sp. WCA-380-WT-3A]|uniref:MarR family transcriptional regulator n=1 Tax=Cutibacterium porci TaxID=2605781 RepID=A0A7K0J9H2_9ACTN|nr:MarR family transcriptional regulator [Cutibacterium porci]MSS46596.1 MarR family transcriptional regulator [Cutibacterium porci]
MKIMSQGGSRGSIRGNANDAGNDTESRVENSAAEPWLSIEQQRVWREWLLASAHITSHLVADLRRDGLDVCEYEILVTLSEADDAVRMSVLAAQVRQSKSRLTHAIERLEDRGFVTREPDGRDRRGVVARLTPAGIDQLREVTPHYARAVRHIFIDPVDPQDFAAVGRAMTAILSVPD